jgi:hypothetical protein
MPLIGRARLFLHPLPGDVHSAPSKPVAYCCGLH